MTATIIIQNGKIKEFISLDEQTSKLSEVKRLIYLKNILDNETLELEKKREYIKISSKLDLIKSIEKNE